MNRITLMFCAALLWPMSGAAWAERISNPIAIFNGLDKITGITTRFEVKVKEEGQFGSLKIKPSICYTRPVTEAPKTTSFVQIEDSGKQLFSGWMFAESPALNALEDPVYDIWLIGCFDPAAPPPPVEGVIAATKPEDGAASSESGDTGTEAEDDGTGEAAIGEDQQTGDPKPGDTKSDGAAPATDTNPDGAAAEKSGDRDAASGADAGSEDATPIDPTLVKPGTAEPDQPVDGAAELVPMINDDTTPPRN
jgi:hypothetical protein